MVIVKIIITLVKKHPEFHRNSTGIPPEFQVQTGFRAESGGIPGGGTRNFEIRRNARSGVLESSGIPGGGTRNSGVQ